MKKIIFIVALCIGLSVSAQKKTTIPDAAKASFTKSFPAAMEVKWAKEDANYEVDFLLNGKKMSAEYDAKGMLIETELSVTASELPAAVMPYVNQHYKGAAIKGMAKVTKPNGEINYELGIKGKDVMFDAKGKFLKEEKD